MEKNTKKHLSLMATTMLKISMKMEKYKETFKEQEARLQEQDDKLQEQEDKLQEQEDKLQEQEDKLQKQEQKLLELEEHGHDEATKLKDINAELQYNTGYVYWFPVTMTMPHYEQLKAGNKWWYSPAMYTDMCGYSFRIGVYPNGS